MSLSALRDDLKRTVSFDVGLQSPSRAITVFRLQARLVAEAILEVKANAAKAHEDLGTFIQQAIDKGAQSSEAIEADRVRLVNEVCFQHGSKLKTLPRSPIFLFNRSIPTNPEGDTPREGGRQRGQGTGANPRNQREGPPR